VARPKDADKVRTYDEIVGTACRMLSQRDDPTTHTLREVSGASGLSLGTLHYYFASKTELLEACLDTYYERLRALGARLLAELPADPSGHRAFVDRVVRELARFVRAERSNVRLRLVLSASAGELPPTRQADFLDVTIQHAVAGLAPLTSRAPGSLALAIQSMAILVVRFALASEGEKRSLLGLEGDAADAAVDAFLSDTAWRLVRPDASLSGP
jgi:AcrR family transcriptional regulator